MQNPYKQEHPFQYNSYGKIVCMVVQTLSGRMTNTQTFNPHTFFEASGGELWWSGERFKLQYRYARDYAAPIFDRYRQRFGYLPIEKMHRFVQKIAARWDWWSHAKVRLDRYTDEFEDRYVPFTASGTFTEIDFFSEKTCERCGSPVHYVVGPLRKERSQIDRRDIRIDDAPDLICFTKAYYAKNVCSSKICREIETFMETGKCSITDEAKHLRVMPKRPLAKLRAATTETEKYLIAAAALLDFEARFQQKRQNLNEGRL